MTIEKTTVIAGDIRILSRLYGTALGGSAFSRPQIDQNRRGLKIRRRFRWHGPFLSLIEAHYSFADSAEGVLFSITSGTRGYEH